MVVKIEINTDGIAKITDPLTGEVRSGINAKAHRDYLAEQNQKMQEIIDLRAEEISEISAALDKIKEVISKQPGFLKRLLAIVNGLFSTRKK